MGYQSEVAFKAQFKSIEDRDKVIATLPEKYQAIIQNPDNVALPDDRPVAFFHYDSIKWYSTSELEAFGFYGASGYELVDACEALVSACRSAAWADRVKNEEIEYVPNVGAFAIVGEDYEDIKADYWEPSYEDQRAYGLPDSYEMLSVQRFIDFSEDKEN